MNIEDVADRSIKYLSKNVSDTPIDFDWKNRFFNKVQDINSDELKEIWAKILGNEVSNPGNVSIRALELLSNLDKKEAELFEKLASMSVFNHVAIELKIGGFKPEYIGKMNMYLSLLDRLERGENENQSIGIILCADRDHLDVEIALQDVNKPIGVAEYQLLLPKEELQTLLLNEIKAIEEESTFEEN